MFGPDLAQNVVYALAAAAAVLVLEVLYLQLVAGRRRRAINRRLQTIGDDGPDNEGALRRLLKERGLSESGDYAFGLVWVNRLYAQSGITQNPIRYVLVFVIAGLAVAAGLFVLRVPLFAVISVFLVVAVVVPLLRLRRARARRLRAFERQLPDALDMIIRSLRAGHPVPVAVGLVGREMPDPVGTEFGIVYDEVTFGAQLEHAVRKMAERVGFEGLQLLSVALSIQSKTGGNLTEVLANLSRTLRERLVLRLKVRALASEGKLSAWLMSLFPLIMFAILLLVAPSYYGGIWSDPIVVPVMVGFGVLALLGDFIMFRMVNFDF
ncbi:MAG TPA: type II secretion system F family protein [Devosia sp.]